MSDMRIGGLATGMDIDKIVGDLMKAERMPLDKMEQDKTWLTWKRDAYREANKQLFEFDQMMLDMKLQSTFNSKSTTSSQDGEVTATASSGTSTGNYNIEVTQLASSAINVSQNGITAAGKTFYPDMAIGDIPAGTLKSDIQAGAYSFHTFNEDGQQQDYSFTITAQDSLNDVLKGITEADNGVRAFYDKQADKVIFERTVTGNFNTGAEINFDPASSFFTALDLDTAAETDGQNAKFIYNGALSIESFENNYTLNGITFQFNDVTSGQAKITVNSNVDKAVEKITAFVDKYNNIVESLNEQTREKRYRDFLPLTDKQKEDMEEKEIELWEEKAKSGMLLNDAVIQGALYDMRDNWYRPVTNTGAYSHLTGIGIKTSSNYLDGGKLIIKEEDLRTALTEDPESVQRLFANEGTDSESMGIVQRLETTLENTRKAIEEKAGKPTSVDTTFTLGKELKRLDDRMDTFQDRLNMIEDRYWAQFTEMEKAISRLNSQSAYLMQQFGGGM